MNIILLTTDHFPNEKHYRFKVDDEIIVVKDYYENISGKISITSIIEDDKGNVIHPENSIMDSIFNIIDVTNNN